MRIHRLIAAWGALALTASIPPEAQAQEPIRFRAYLTPAPADDVYIGRIPTLDAVTFPESISIPVEIADQLKQAVRTTLAGQEDGRRFGIIHLIGQPFRVTARAWPRSENQHLVEPFFQQLQACFSSLEDGEQVTALYLLLYGFTPEDPELTLELATRASRQMVDNLNTPDACATRRNSIPITGVVERRFRNATQGMLTEAFDYRYFSASGMLAVSQALHPFFFGSRGLWVREKYARLKVILAESFQSGFLTQAEFSALAPKRYTSFLDWASSVKRLKPGLAPEFITLVGELCQGTSYEALFTPFRLQDCLDGGRVNPVQFRFEAGTYVLIKPGGAP